MAEFLDCIDLFGGTRERAYPDQITSMEWDTASTILMAADREPSTGRLPVNLYSQAEDRDSSHVALWRMTDDSGDPLGHLALAAKSRPGARFWKELHQSLPHANTFASSVDDRPGAPWLAMACPDFGLRTMGGDLSSVYRITRAIGWTWLGANR